MSYFDSGVYECPFWQVELSKMIKTGIKVDATVFVVSTKIG